MDTPGIDRLSRSLANRRQAVRALGGAGLLAALPGARLAAAQGTIVTCQREFRATVATGPNAEVVWLGDLMLLIDAAGNIDEGTLQSPEGQTWDVTGSATGRAIDLRIDLGSGQVLSLQGAAKRDIDQCRGDFTGIFAGPDIGDLGVWTAVRPGSDGTS